jgi:hypothetical protein
MSRKGRLLEVMVRRLEEFLAPEGVVVKSPEEFYDEDGRKIGEIDVTLRGDFGSSEIFVGIECRDRPSDGPQGRGWIREVKGKRDDLKVDKMIAVSTTGFTGPAVDLASSWSIDLLTVEDVTRLDLRGWFEILDFCFTDDSYEISGIVDITTVPTAPTRTERSALFLRSAISGELVPLKEFIQPELDRLFDTLPVSPGVVHELKTTLQINGPIDAVADETSFTIANMRVPVRISREVVVARALLNACRRLSDDEIVALTGVCRIETKLRKLNAVVTAKRSADGSSLKLDFLDDNYGPCEMPAGTRFWLFGRE